MSTIQEDNPNENNGESRGNTSQQTISEDNLRTDPRLT